MKKLKLNIQRFSSTNHTQYYDLSQYTANDKPTYLIDYNGDMLKIDTALYNATQKGLENESAIGTLSNLNTTAKNNLVSAINEVNTQVGTNTSNIGQNTLDISANTTAIGTLADLSTTNKSNLVNAINEVKSVNDTQNTDITELQGLVNKFNLSNIISLGVSDLTGGAYGDGNGLTCVFNSDYSICKVYGNLTGVTGNGYIHEYESVNPVIPVGYRPISDITVNPCGVSEYSHNEDFYNKSVYLTFESNGKIKVTINKGNNLNVEMTTSVIPFLIFLKDFGDTPTPPQQ